MFTIIGGDGKEYGPVTAEQVRAWIAGGRANLQTRAKYAGTEEWHTLADYTEFVPGAAIPAPAPSLPPVAAAVAGLEPAGRGARLGARCIDWVISIASIMPGLVIAGSSILKVVIDAAQGHQPNMESEEVAKAGLGLAISGLGWLLALIVQIILLSLRGQSIGKCLTGLRVVVVSTGQQAGFLRGWLLRECLMTVLGIIAGILPLIGILLRPAFHLTDWCMIFRDDRRCLHDLIADTRVVRIPPKA